MEGEQSAQSCTSRFSGDDRSAMGVSTVEWPLETLRRRGFEILCEIGAMEFALRRLLLVERVLEISG